MTTFLSTRPKTLDLDIYAGDGFALRFQFSDKVTAEPWPLEGTWKAEIRDGDGDVVTDFVIDASEADEGKLALSLSATQTESLQGLSSLTWDLQQSVGPRTWYRGAVYATGDVTQ